MEDLSKELEVWQLCFKEPISNERCVLPISWFHRWSAYVLNDTSVRPSPINTQSLLDENGSLRDSISSDNLQTISPSLWNKVEQLYPSSGPQIIRPLASRKKPRNEASDTVNETIDLFVSQRGSRPNDHLLFDVNVSRCQRPYTLSSMHNMR